MKKLLLTLSLATLFSTIQAQNPAFNKCSSCTNAKEAALTPENLVEFFLTKPDQVRQIFESNGYTTEVQAGFCANFFLKKPNENTDLVYKRCEEYFQVTQEEGEKLDDLIKGIKSNFMRDNKNEKWYSISHKNKRYKFTVSTIKEKTTLRVTTF